MNRDSRSGIDVSFRVVPVVLLAGLLSGVLGVVTPAFAENAGPNRGTSAIIEEVVVTARKREERQQEVPISLTAFSADQIEALKIRDLTDISIGMPNVSLDQVGTSRGTANFSIRGLGINSSIISVDPTVGVVIDGVYLAVNNGIIFDAPGLESIQVLRGPQGVLFGRNLVGGAVLINTMKPSEQFEARLSTSLENSDEGGLNKYYSGTIAGPVNDSLSAGVLVFYNDDDGPFTNDFNGNDHGAIEQLVIRPAAVWKPTEDLEIIARYEYLDTDGDGAAGQSHPNTRGLPGSPVNHDPDGFSFSIDFPGEQQTEAHRLTLEANWNVGENGTITNIFGWRDFEAFSSGDIDAQPVHRFHSEEWTEAEQTSNELRYNTVIMDRLNVTAGVYYLDNDVVLHERRILFGGVQTQDGGGKLYVESLGVFGAVDYDLSERWTLSAGLRFTQEEKKAEVTSLILNINNPCRVDQGTCTADLVDDDDWSSWAPMAGAMYNVNDNLRVYGNWNRGFRSGGYNLRNTAVDTVNNGPGPFDQEQIDSFEVGVKSEFSRGFLNGAVFYAEGQDIQRVVLRPDPNPTGGAQIIKNAGDTEYQGVELDGVFDLTDNLALTTNVGYFDGEYTSVSFDINGDGVIDKVDRDLEFARAPKWTYSLGLLHDLPLGSWLMSSRLRYAYREDSFADDDNDSLLPELRIIDAGIDFYSNDGHWKVGVFGNNLTNETKWGIEVLLSPGLGNGTFAPLQEPRRYGVELTYNFF